MKRKKLRLLKNYLNGGNYENEKNHIVNMRRIDILCQR